MNKSTTRRLREGDVLQKVFDSGSSQIWHVATIVEANGILHARLRLRSDPTVAKALSLYGIFKDRRFSVVPRREEP